MIGYPESICDEVRLRTTSNGGLVILGLRIFYIRADVPDIHAQGGTPDPVSGVGVQGGEQLLYSPDPRLALYDGTGFVG